MFAPGLIMLAAKMNRESEWRLREASDFNDLIRYEKVLIDYHRDDKVESRVSCMEKRGFAPQT